MSVLMVEILTDGFARVSDALNTLKANNVPAAVGDENKSDNRQKLFTLLVPSAREIEARRLLGLLVEGGRR